MATIRPTPSSRLARMAYVSSCTSPSASTSSSTPCKPPPTLPPAPLLNLSRREQAYLPQRGYTPKPRVALAHPGKTRPTNNPYPEGVARWTRELCNPFGVERLSLPSLPRVRYRDPGL